MTHDQPLKFANISAHLLEAVGQSKRYAITHVDPVGVIERFIATDVASEVLQWAQLVREKGLEPGNRVVVLAGPAWEWRCALLGVLQAGGVAVPCPESTPVAEIQAIAAHAGAALVVSIPARPDLVERDGPPVLTAGELETIDVAKALAHPAHQALPGDLALILYGRDGLGLRGVMHTHGSLIAQADSGEHWLGLREGERVWCTAADGSAASIWLLLPAWRQGANIVTVDLELDPEAQLELLDRLGAAALWFSDEEYGALASGAGPASVDLGSIRHALVSEASSAGATAFEDAFGARVTPLFGLNELGIVAGWPAGAEHDAVAGTAMPLPGVRLAIVDEHGAELPAGRVGDVVVRGDAPSLFSGYAGGDTQRRDSWFHLGWRGALGGDHSLRLVSRPPLETDLVEAEVEMPGAALVDEGDLAALEEIADQPEATIPPSKREAKRARRKEERQATERQKVEERRRREEEKSRELAERAAAKERKEAERAEREAAQIAARHRAKDENGGGRAQRREEKKVRRREEQEAKERQKAEAAERAEREAAEAEERRRAEEATRAEERRRAEDENRGGRKRRREEKRARRREDQLARERQKAEAAERAEREAAEAEERRRAEEASRAEERRRAEDDKRREREQRREEKEAHRRQEQEAREAARAQRKTARPGKRRRAKEPEPAKNGKRGQKEHRREAAERSERERLAPDILSRISQYGLTASPIEPDERRDSETDTEPHIAAEPTERQDDK